MDGTRLSPDMWVWGTERETGVTRRLAGVRESLEASAFWLAVVFPIFYVPPLTAGIETLEQSAAFGALVAFHLVLLTTGHTYER